MKRYRLVEATSLSGYGMLREEAAIGAVKKALAPIEHKIFRLDWDKIEDRLGGPVPYNVREKVEAACGGPIFRGLTVTAGLALLSGLGIWWVIYESFWYLSFSRSLAIVSVLMFIINICATFILHKLFMKKISDSGIESCVKSAKKGELKSSIVIKALKESDKAKNDNKIDAYIVLMITALAIVVVIAI